MCIKKMIQYAKSKLGDWNTEDEDSLSHFDCLLFIHYSALRLDWSLNQILVNVTQNK